jgi:hypothetical protein
MRSFWNLPEVTATLLQGLTKIKPSQPTNQQTKTGKIHSILGHPEEIQIIFRRLRFKLRARENKTSLHHRRNTSSE